MSDQKRQIGMLKFQAEELNRKHLETKDSVKDIMESIGQKLKWYAKNDRVTLLETALEDSQERKFKTLEKKIRSYTPQLMYDDYVHKTDRELKEMYERFKPLISSIQVDVKANQVKESLDLHFAAFSMKKDCKEDKRQLQNVIKSLRTQISEDAEKVSVLEKEAKDNAILIKKKAE